MGNLAMWLSPLFLNTGGHVPPRALAMRLSKKSNKNKENVKGSKDFKGKTLKVGMFAGIGAVFYSLLNKITKSPIFWVFLVVLVYLKLGGKKWMRDS